MYADLVCKGGGIKGIALVGALSYFEKYGYTWKRVAGTSVGAIVASLVAVGYSSLEIKDIIFDLDFEKFVDKNNLASIPCIGSIASLMVYKGFNKGNYLENFLGELFEKKGKKYFRDISFNGISNLKIIASDITRQKLIVLPDDLVEYNINPLDFEIAKAVRMSASLPFFYEPVILKKNNTSCYIVDGGLLSNFPIWIFDVKCNPRWPTFGFNLYDENKEYNKNNTFNEYLMSILETSLMTNEEIYFENFDKFRIVDIPTLGVDITNFSLSYEEIKKLYLSGYNSAQKFLQNFDFNSYILYHRNIQCK